MVNMPFPIDATKNEYPITEKTVFAFPLPLNSKKKRRKHPIYNNSVTDSQKNASTKEKVRKEDKPEEDIKLTSSFSPT